MSELESLFSAAVPNPDQEGSVRRSGSRSSLVQKPEKVQLVILQPPHVESFISIIFLFDNGERALDGATLGPLTSTVHEERQSVARRS